ncbi:MAG: 30S ribosomal protein S17e [Candidatus Nanohaloarchaea archaeon]|nr:30S ribosomal protein S17e [Candidatus Nanohaloarchaea archaeon]
MGRVRPTHIKRLARDLVKKHPDSFEKDFDHNKQALKEIDKFESRKVRNRVAGYIVRVLENQRFEQ